MDCDVTLDAELGVGPNGAYLFEATTNAEGRTLRWNVNGSILAEGRKATFEWFDILGAPWWEVCVMMVTPDGCGAMDCMSREDFQVALRTGHCRRNADTRVLMCWRPMDFQTMP